MADAALSVLEKLADPALKKALELYQVSDQVEPMQVKLRLIQSFLKDADSKHNKNPVFKQWVKEIRDVSTRIEGALDRFQVEIQEKNEKPPKCCGFRRKAKMLAKHPMKLAWLSDELKKINVILETINVTQLQLGITNYSGDSSEGSNPVALRPTQLHYIDVSDVVGFESDQQKIIKHLLDRSIPRRTVLSIVGTGGLGKTTLAKKIYESPDVEGNFDCRAWLSISQKFVLTKVLRDMLYSVDDKMKDKKPPVFDKDLPKELQKALGNKRYLIILDDVWTENVWEQLKIALPDLENGSRVLVTSRSLEVAKGADPGTTPHELRYLTEEESVTLLLRKGLPYKQRNQYPPNVVKAAEQCAKKCGGLPLALTVLGGILSKKDPTYSAWKTVEQNLDWFSKKGEECSAVVAMSYKDLPYHLKQCFLYFAAFPEDHKISAKHVTLMWIAEGLVQKDGPGTLQDKAQEYLEELAQRCLLQVIEKSWKGNCKYCNMHDILRDLTIHEAKEDNFFTVFTKEEDRSQLDARVAPRAALQFCTPIEYGINSTNTRSLIFFGQSISNFSGFKLLRVLNIERVNMIEKEVVAYESWLKGLIHLRYLGFRYCKMPMEFGCVSFSSLTNLETIDFKGTYFKDELDHSLRAVELELDIDHSLWEVPALRQVMCPWLFPLTCNLSKWDHLKNVETLKWVRLKNIPELGCNMNLRNLGLRLRNFVEQCRSDEEAWHMLKGLLRRMELLTTLRLWSDANVALLFGDTSGLACYETIQNLYLHGEWPASIALHVEMLPANLAKLTLVHSKFKEDPMPVLERLQNLRILCLWAESYMGTRLKCSMGGFPSLEQLHLGGLPNLHHWEIEERAMPILSQLEIRHCKQLHELPELQKVPTLQNLIIEDPSKELYERMQSEDRYKIEHIPSVHIKDPPMTEETSLSSNLPFNLDPLFPSN